jgi:hypothetical protein
MGSKKQREFAEIRLPQRRGDERERDAVMLKAMTHKMTIYLNMLSVLTKDYIVSNLNSTFVVTIHRSGVR